MDAAATGGNTGAGTAPIPDEAHGADLPLTMSASVVLSGLPRDAHKALADAEAIDTGKGRSRNRFLFVSFYYFIVALGIICTFPIIDVFILDLSVVVVCCWSNCQGRPSWLIDSQPFKL